MGSTTTLTYNTTTHSRQHEEFSCHSFCQHCPRQTRPRGQSCSSSWSSSPAPTSRSAHGSPARSPCSSHSSPARSPRSSRSSPAPSPRGSPSCRSPSGCPPQCLSPRANGRGEGCPPTIAELVVSDSRFSTLLAAVKAADLVETLSGEGPFTVFAPTNAAFEKVPKEALAGLLENKEELTKVLLRHVVPSAIQGKNIPPGTTNLATAGGEKIDVTRNQNNIIQIKSDAGSAYVILFDVIASNGVIHAVDTVF